MTAGLHPITNGASMTSCIQRGLVPRAIVPTLAALFAAAATLLGAASAGADELGSDYWRTREAVAGQAINSKSVERLGVKWVWEAAGDLTAIPAYDADSIYIGDGGGKLSRVDRASGKTVWQVAIPELTGNDKSLSLATPMTRSTPALSGDRLVIGTRDGFAVAVSRKTGALLWRTRLDAHAATMVTGSATVHRNVVYIGTSSTEAALAVDPSYPCCTFRGSASALDLATGQVLWKTYTVPEGFSGGPVWGGPPVIDVARNRVIFGSGNNYTVPPNVGACLKKQLAQKASTAECATEGNDFDSIIAFDLKTGAKVWAFHGEPFDAWTLACGIPEFGFPAAPHCPVLGSPDHDFGAGVNLFQITDASGKKLDVVGAGAKSGKYWLLRADDGKEIWHTQVEAGGAGGGIMWGTSVAANRIFVGMANSIGKPLPLLDGSQTRRGGWAALNAADGQVLWKTIDPRNKGRGVGPTTVVNDIMFAASFDPEGHFYALDVASGRILWDFASGGSAISGPVITGDTVYWGSGYAAQGGKGNNKLYAFQLSKQ
jgi:polyvinyl alcohol dehydrogenase (cytochrome)